MTRSTAKLDYAITDSNELWISDSLRANLQIRSVNFSIAFKKKKAHKKGEVESLSTSMEELNETVVELSGAINQLSATIA